MVEINNKINKDISNLKIEERLEFFFIFLQNKKIIRSQQKINLSIAIIDKEEINKLNSTYRKKDEATDVLSFCYVKSKEEIEGEIILNLDVIEKNAKKYKKTNVYEFFNCLFHGFLHIINFEHGKDMFQIQEEAIKLLDVK